MQEQDKLPNSLSFPPSLLSSLPLSPILIHTLLVANPFDDLNLALVSGGATFNQWYGRCQAHEVDMPPCVQVVEGIENQVESLEPFNVELGFLYVCVVCFQLDIGIELARRFFGHDGLGLLDVLHAEQELPVEVAQVDRIQVHQVDLAETGEDETFQEFATDASGANHQDSRLRRMAVS